jgi:hypothetical protein
MSGKLDLVAEHSVHSPKHMQKLLRRDCASGLEKQSPNGFLYRVMHLKH